MFKLIGVILILLGIAGIVSSMQNISMSQDVLLQYENVIQKIEKNILEIKINSKELSTLKVDLNSLKYHLMGDRILFQHFLSVFLNIIAIISGLGIIVRKDFFNKLVIWYAVLTLLYWPVHRFLQYIDTKIILQTFTSIYATLSRISVSQPAIETLPYSVQQSSTFEEFLAKTIMSVVFLFFHIFVIFYLLGARKSSFNSNC